MLVISYLVVATVLAIGVGRAATVVKEKSIEA